jgi:hypothetical protein
MKAKGSLIDGTEFCLFSSPHGNDNMTLRDQFHRELVNRPFQFNKRSQLFVALTVLWFTVIAAAIVMPITAHAIGLLAGIIVIGATLI